MTQEAKKRGLGRGLDALFGEAEPAHYKTAQTVPQPVVQASAPAPVAAAAPVAASPSSVPAHPRTLPVAKLSPGKYQPRHNFDEEAIVQLAQSISSHGVLQPLLVRPLANGQYEIIAGERRWRAAQRAKLHEVPVIIQNLNDTDTLEIALIENLQRQDLTALEEAEGFQRLMDEFKHSQENLAEKLGKSRSYVANTLRLLKLPDAVKKMLQDKSLSAGHARALLGAQDPLRLAHEIVKQGLSVRAVEKIVQQENLPVADKVKALGGKILKAKDANIAALEDDLANMLGMKVSIESQGAHGKLILNYKTLEDLDMLLERLSHNLKK